MLKSACRNCVRYMGKRLRITPSRSGVRDHLRPPFCLVWIHRLRGRCAIFEHVRPVAVGHFIDIVSWRCPGCLCQVGVSELTTRSSDSVLITCDSGKTTNALSMKRCTLMLGSLWRFKAAQVTSRTREAFIVDTRREESLYSHHFRHHMNAALLMTKIL